MKISKLFHYLYFMVMFLPCFIIPIFAININQKSVEPISIEVQEKISVDFNQQIENGDFADNSKWIVQGQTTTISISDNECTFTYQTTGTSSGLSYNVSNTFIENHVYYTKAVVLSNNDFDTYVAIGQSYVFGQTLLQPNQSVTIDYYWKVTTVSGNYRWFEIGNRSANNLLYSFTTSNVCLFDLTQMFGEGNEPTKDEFKTMFPNSYYPYTESQKMLVDKPSLTTYDDTDIGSQFLYSLYKPVNDYFNFSKYFGLEGIYDWFQMNWFNGTAPLSFFIFYNLMIYWLIISILWLLFDVLLYVPLLIHRWLDKASIS